VCLDNNILIWAIRQTCTPGQEDMLKRADALMQELSEHKAQIIVPAVVLAEFLAFVSPEKHAAVISTFEHRFQIHPFDARAAALAAELWHRNAQGSPSLKDQIKSAFPEIGRVRIKADTMILATAITGQADVLYTHDGPLTMMAKGRIAVKGMPPPLPAQDDFLGDET
jgi:predicted nucleic acid-binding protein